MAAPTEAEIVKILEGVRDSVTGRNVVESGFIEGLATRGGHVSFAVEVPAERGPTAEPLRRACEQAVARIPGVLSVSVVLTAHRERNARGARTPAAPPAPAHAHGHQHQHGPAPTDTNKGVPGVQSIIAVA